MTMTIGSTELGAKLLATENIAVLRARVRTASFDIKSRVLTLPQWKELSPVVEQMLIGHEVGHALYTTEEYTAPIEENNAMQSYLNVIEDVRIEKLMKRKYPGIRKVMHQGYKELNEKDFFGIAKIQNVNELNFIDRINLYFKAGFDCGVKFSSEEKEFVVRAEKTETIQDVIELAKEIYEYSKQKAQEKKEQAINNMTQEDEEDFEYDLSQSLNEDLEQYDSDDDDEDGEGDVTQYQATSSHLSDEEKQEFLKNRLEHEIEDELKSKTEESFQDKLNNLADDTIQYNYWRLDERVIVDPVISYKTVLKETEGIDETFMPSLKLEIEKFKTESSRVVNYLIKEFEMKKSATLYKRATTSKIGSLDMRKVWSYKLNDDLFKRITSIPKGKNHGMVMILDWSGSMTHVIQDTMKQVINLAMFCKRSQIPFQVFAFTTEYNRTNKVGADASDLQTEFLSNENVLGNAINPYFSLLELFSSKMTNSEFNTMIRRMYDPLKLWTIRGYSMGGTPLNETLSYMLSYIPKFQKMNNVEKLSFITLTDGEGSTLITSSGKYLNDSTYDYNIGKSIKINNFLRDHITKKDYPITRSGTTQTEAILRMIKERYDPTIVGFYVCRNSRYELSSAIDCNLPGFEGNKYELIDSMRESFKKDGFASLMNTGRDDLFIIPQSKLQIEDGNLVVEEKQNARQIAKMFSKQMGGKTTSRVLLNKFIGYIA